MNSQWYTDYLKVEKIILSCETLPQLEMAVEISHRIGVEFLPPNRFGQAIIEHMTVELSALAQGVYDRLTQPEHPVDDFGNSWAGKGLFFKQDKPA